MLRVDDLRVGLRLGRMLGGEPLHQRLRLRQIAGSRPARAPPGSGSCPPGCWRAPCPPRRRPRFLPREPAARTPARRTSRRPGRRLGRQIGGRALLENLRRVSEPPLDGGQHRRGRRRRRTRPARRASPASDRSAIACARLTLAQLRERQREQRIRIRLRHRARFLLRRSAKSPA